MHQADGVSNRPSLCIAENGLIGEAGFEVGSAPTWSGGSFFALNGLNRSAEFSCLSSFTHQNDQWVTLLLHEAAS